MLRWWLRLLFKRPGLPTFWVAPGTAIHFKGTPIPISHVIEVDDDLV